MCCGSYANVIKLYIMTSRILNRFNIKTDRLLRSIATDKLSCDIHPRKMIKMVRRVSRDHIIIIHDKPGKKKPQIIPSINMSTLLFGTDILLSVLSAAVQYGTYQITRVEA